MEDMGKKVKICAETRDKHTGGQFIICARTDARGVEGIESTITRSKHYIDQGADMIFPEGLASLDEFKRVADELKAHKEDVFLLANMTEFGKTPLIHLSDF
jgi:methylisocitrate lyase